MGGRARLGAVAALTLAGGLVLLGVGVGLSAPPAGGRQIIGTSPTTETVPTTEAPPTTEPAPTTVTTSAPTTTEPARAPTTTEPPAAATTVARTTTTTGVPRTLPSTTVALPPPQLPVRSATTQPTPFVLDDDTRLPAAFAVVGGVGLLATGGLLATQWVLTRPGRRGRTL